MRLLLLLFLWQISFCSYAKEDGTERATATEMQMLPKLCQLRFKYGKGSPEFAKWERILGEGAVHVHHYCDGLVILQRSYTRDKYRQSRLKSARSNFNYVLARTQDPKYILLPDIYYRLAIISKEEKKPAEAIDLANKSIQAKKNYLNPYLLLSELYVQLGKKGEAKKVLLEAKQYHPNSKRLKSRLKSL